MSKNTKKSARKPVRKISYESSAKGLTSQSGVIPVIHFMKNLGFDEVCREQIDFQRGDNSKYSLADSLFMTLVGIVAGAGSLLKVVAVWSDQVLREVSGWLSVPDDSTLGRIFRKARLKHVAQLEIVNHRLRERVWSRALKSGALPPGDFYKSWVDVDSTVKTVFGKQEGAAKGYNTHKRGAMSYHPLVAFASHTKEILQAWLRAGNVYTSNGIVEFMKQLAVQMPPGMRILFRGDSGFFTGELMDWLDQNSHGYLIKVKLKGLVPLLDKQCWQVISHSPGWEQCEFSHQCAKWSYARHFVAVRRLRKVTDDSPQKSLINEPVYDYFCYVTTERLTPWQTHKTYGERATCETWLDEAKNQMGMAHIKSHDFMASSLLFQCAVMAYNTVRWMTLLSDNEILRRWEIQSVRTFLIRTAGRLLTGSNQLKVKVPDKHLYPGPWNAWLNLSFLRI
jgi:hypothetical protein